MFALPAVDPVELDNHTKDIGNWAPVETFAKTISEAHDLEVITLTEVANNLKAGLYRPVLKA